MDKQSKTANQRYRSILLEKHAMAALSRNNAKIHCDMSMIHVMLQCHVEKGLKLSIIHDIRHLHISMVLFPCAHAQDSIRNPRELGSTQVQNKWDYVQPAVKIDCWRTIKCSTTNNFVRNSFDIVCTKLYGQSTWPILRGVHISWYWVGLLISIYNCSPNFPQWCLYQCILISWWRRFNGNS